MGTPGPVPRRRALALLGVVAAALVVITVVLTRGHAGEARVDGPSVSTESGSWELPSLKGGPNVRLSDFRGKPLVVNFFASWCTECRAELPAFAAVAERLKGRVNFVGVNSLETGDGLAMARQYGIGGWPLAADAGGANSSGLHDALGGQGMPLTAIYDASGNLVTVHLGVFAEADLVETLRSRLGVTGG